MDFSILILSYNSDYRKMLFTIDSVLKQKDVSFEIIVCDDASRENNFAQLDAYLSDKNIPYRLLGSRENLGTVCNILRGLTIASGTYAKLIGAGDMLYHTHTLYDVAQFMQREHASSCFGLLHGYQQKDGHYRTLSQISPRDILAYRQKDEKKICHNLMLCEDWVSGAAIFATTEYYKKYISLLKGHVLYCEDWATGLAAVNHEYLHFMDTYVVWYEVGDGISTSPNSSFRQKLLQDNENYWKLFDSYCEQNSPGEFNKYIRKRRRKKLLEHVPYEWVKLAYKSIVNPDMILFELQAGKQLRQQQHIPQNNVPSDILNI